MAISKRWRWLSALLVLTLLLPLLPPAAFAAQSHTVSGLADTEYYTVQVADKTGSDGSYTVDPGGNLTFTIAMRPGYTQSGILVLRAGNEISPTVGKTYTLSNITKDTEVTIQSSTGEWAKDKYKVTIPKSGEGFSLTSVQVGEAVADTSIGTGADGYVANVTHGERVTFVLTLSDGYTESAPVVKVGGGNLKGEKDGEKVTYIIESVTATQVVSITAPAPNRHAITFPEQEERVGYTIEGLNGATSVANGGTYQFTVTLKDGYKNSRITVTAHQTGEPGANKTVKLQAGGVYTIDNVSAPLTIVVSGVTPDQCTVSWKNTPAYTITAKGGQTGAVSAKAAYNGSFVFDLLRNEGWSQAEIKVMAGTEVLVGAPDENPLLTTYTITKVTGDTVITVSDVTGNTYTVKWVVAGTPYTEDAVPFETQPAFKGSTLKDSTPQYHYAFKGWAAQKVDDGEPVGPAPSTDFADYDPAKAPGEDGFYDQSLETAETLPKVTEDVIYHAVYEKTVRTYPVTWTVEGVAIIENGAYNEIPAYKVDGQVSTPVKEADSAFTYTFAGWKVNGVGTTIKDPLPAVTEAVNYVAQFTPVPKTYTLTVEFEYDESAVGAGKPELPATYTDATLKVGDSYSLDCTAGVYLLNGYHASPAVVSGVMPAKDVNVTVTYFPNTSVAYTVEHHLQNLDTPTQYDKQTDDTQTLYGATGNDTQAAAKYYPGFTAQAIVQEKISGDAGSATVVVIQYDRNKHSVTWDAGEGAFSGDSGSKTFVQQDVPYGTVITNPQAEPTRASDSYYDYTFGGWQGYTDVDTMPDSDVTYHAIWNTGNRGYELKVTYQFQQGYTGTARIPDPYTESYSTGESYTVTSPALAGFTPDQSVIKGYMPSEPMAFTVTYVPNTDTPYKVETYLQNADGSYEETANNIYTAENKFSETDAVTYVGTTGAQTTLTGEEYSYENYHLDKDKTDGSVIDGVANVEIIGDEPGTVKIYYARDTYTLTWDDNGGTLASSDSYTPAGATRWGAPLTAPTTTDAPELTRTGYAFDKWEITLDPETEVVTAVPETMPLANLTAKALWTANTYTVTFVPGEGASLIRNGVALGGDETNQLPVTYDAPYGKLPKATMSEKVFQGWFTEQTDGEQIKADTAVKLTEDTFLYARFGDSKPEGGDGTTPEGGGGNGGGGGGGGAAVKPDKETVTNPDGSVTETVTDKNTGTVTETTKKPDGSETVVVTQKDGSTTETRTSADGVKVEINVSPEGAITGAVTLPEGIDGETVLIPAEQTTPGTVILITGEDGVERVLMGCVPTEEGMLARFDASCQYRVADAGRSFSDVPADFWAADALQFVSAHGLFEGTSETDFSPDGDMTRAMLMTVLARLSGQDTTGGGQWYEKAMDWALEQGISDGTNPGGSVTREQLATMLYRLSGGPEIEESTLAYADQQEISDYARAAMTWAVEQGILNGIGNGLLSPQGTATRAQVAAMLQRYVEQMLR